MTGLAWHAVPLPESWKYVQMRRLVEINNGRDYKAVEVVEGGYPVYGSGGEFRRASDYLHDGPAVLFGRKGTIDRPLLVKGKFWTVDTMFYVVPRERIDVRFLYYVATTIPYGYYVTSTALPSMTQSDLGSYPVPLPPKDRQEAIADFLDRETAQIDTLIAKQQRLIATLRERKDAQWDRLYATALEAGSRQPIRRAVESIVDGPFGSSLTSAHYSDAGVRVIRLANIGVNEFKDDDSAFISEQYAATLNAHAAHAGDVIVAGLGDEKMPLGRATVLPEIGPAIVKADCYRIRPNEHVSPEYLSWVMCAPATRNEMKLLSRGATRERLNTSVVRRAPIPIPPREVQARIVREHQGATAAIDTLIQRSERLIELSQERRAALITAAVTGQIDVRKAA